MGVRGLTTFIAKNQENYFQEYKLHDTYVVLDAHSICAQLYKFHTKSNDCFGGDYDKYGRSIQDFFTMFKQCNVTPIVVFDGGYEKRKLKTVYDRLKNKIKIVRNPNPVSLSGGVFPLFIREVFRDIVLKLEILTARCDFEADLEIACIARQLNCPVISYDSDFYIFDVLYIPFPTLDFHTTKNGDKRYMKCKIYNIERFLKQFGGLNKTQIPLMATILGNDYIRKGRFKNFYSHLKLTKKKIGERGDQQRQITAVIKWLQTETYESAVKKILGRIKKKNRCVIAREINKISNGYITTDSEILQFLNITRKKNDKSQLEMNIQIDDIESDSENENYDSENDSKNDSDDSEHEQMDLDVINETENVDIPDWFVERYRKSEFPTFFMDLLSLTNVFYIPQVENIRNLQTIQISLPVLKIIARILLQNEFTYFIYWARNAYGRIKKYNIDISDLKLPSLPEINALSIDERRDLLFESLQINDNEMKILSEIPTEWRLYIISMLYWAKNAVEPTATLSHIYALVLCMINVYIVDRTIGYCRTKLYFSNKYATTLNGILENKKINNDASTITKNDCICFASIFVTNFTINDKVASNPKAFCLDTVDGFAQFQNCLYFIKHLNCLLLYPLEDCNVSDFYNGTFLYNLHVNFESRSDSEAYVDLLLRNSPSVLNLFKKVTGLVKSVLDLKASGSVHKKRRRRRRKGGRNKNERDEERNEIGENSDGDSDVDVNNRFSVLRFVE